MYFVLPRDTVLQAGKYVVCVFVLWNEMAFKYDGCTDTHLRVLCYDELHMKRFDEDAGKELWTRAPVTYQQEYAISFTEEEIQTQWDEFSANDSMNFEEFVPFLEKIMETAEREDFEIQWNLINPERKDAIDFFDFKVFLSYVW